jgi:hypothetical protein
MDTKSEKSDEAGAIQERNKQGRRDLAIVK